MPSPVNVSPASSRHSPVIRYTSSLHRCRRDPAPLTSIGPPLNRSLPESGHVDGRIVRNGQPAQSRASAPCICNLAAAIAYAGTYCTAHQRLSPSNSAGQLRHRPPPAGCTLPDTAVMSLLAKIAQPHLPSLSLPRDDCRFHSGKMPPVRPTLSPGLVAMIAA